MSSASASFESAAADAWRPAINPWIIALTVTLATFMEVLDTSIANVPCLTSPEVSPPGRTKAPGSSLLI